MTTKSNLTPDLREYQASEIARIEVFLNVCRFAYWNDLASLKPAIAFQIGLEAAALIKKIGGSYRD